MTTLLRLLPFTLLLGGCLQQLGSGAGPSQDGASGDLEDGTSDPVEANGARGVS